jgi:hypothetical protein
MEEFSYTEKVKGNRVNGFGAFGSFVPKYSNIEENQKRPGSVTANQESI